MSDSLKHTVLSGMVWNAIERFGASLFLFISNLVLARLLSPDDFGCIAMLLVFISVSDAIIDGGFGSALIQKKNTTATDYSTVFYWNLLLSFILYAVLYLCAPAIAGFYNIPLLDNVLKVQGIVLIINALVLIQQNILKKQIAFKKIAKINLTAIVAGTGMGILLAFLGCGIWSLVVKSLATGMVQCGIYWLGNKWRPEWVFSWKSFTGLFRYGSFMFLNSIANSLYYSALSLIIGRCFSSVELGYYSQANKLQDVPRNSISSVVTNVTFPVFSNIQEDRAKLRNAFSKCIRSVAFIQFPIIMVLIITARPLVAVLFTDKWLPMVPYFQILAFAGLSSTLFEVHTNVIKSLGKSREVFILEFLLRIMGLTVVAISIRFGMIGLLAGYAFSQFLFYIAASAYGQTDTLRYLFPSSRSCSGLFYRGFGSGFGLLFFSFIRCWTCLFDFNSSFCLFCLVFLFFKNVRAARVRLLFRQIKINNEKTFIEFYESDFSALNLHKLIIHIWL